MKNHDNHRKIFSASSDKKEVIAELNRLAIDGGYVFRGYNKQEELLPGIMREKKMIKYETNMLEDFERYGCNYFHAITPVDFMSYAQHFGIPTRLLDFTYNPFIALFFALFRTKGFNNTVKEDNDYYYIRYASLAENICLPSIGYPNTYSMLEYPIESLYEKASRCISTVMKAYNNGDNRDIRIMYDHKTREKEANEEEETGSSSQPKVDANQEKFLKDAILFIDPNQANQRIIMQQGLFMFPYTLDAAKHMEIVEKNTKYIMIHKAHREELLQYLDTMGYNTYRLNPDIGSICEAIKQKYKENRVER